MFPGMKLCHECRCRFTVGDRCALCEERAEWRREERVGRWDFLFAVGAALGLVSIPVGFLVLKLCS
jgi:hypothetical protein